VLFLCENNLYAMGTHLARAQAVRDLCRKAEGYAVPTVQADGMDVEAVTAAVVPALEAVRAGDGPRFVELLTYRFRAHSMFDPELYREKTEVEAWKRRDPIAQHRARLRARGWHTEEEDRVLEAAVMGEMQDAVSFAEAGTWEPVADLLRHVYAPGPSA
jgi:pyruvate dehydrogenase E1 component alpha subunit